MGSTAGKLVMTVFFAIMLGSNARAAELTASYLYNLSDFNGPKPYSGARIAVDEHRNEMYVMSGESVNVFNASGMEIFRFDHDPNLGTVYDAAVHGGGDLFLLALKERRPIIVRANFRGEPVSTIGLKGLPQQLAQFAPDTILLREEKLFLASLSAMQLVVTDLDGRYLKHVDLAEKIGLTEQERNDSGIGSINFDREGNILFTIPVMAKVYRLEKEEQLTSFGKRGSGPGKFGVIGGVAADGDGNLLVADTLRCAIIMFDKNFKFIREFGGRGFGPGNLIGPNDIVIDGNNRAYVSQIRNRGVSVFQIAKS